MQTIYRDIVSALIWSKDGKLLQGKKDPAKGGVYVDKWHIPGGAIDEGETMDEAIIREVREETGLDISELPRTLVDDQGRGTAKVVKGERDEAVQHQMRFNIFEVHLPQNAADVQATPSDDLVELRWFDRSELDPSELTPPSVKLFQRLGYLPTA